VIREQMVVMLMRCAQHKGWILPAAEEEKPFVDAQQINTWAADAIKQIQRAGIISGRPDGCFDPQGSATRAEVVIAFTNFMKALSK